MKEFIIRRVLLFVLGLVLQNTHAQVVMTLIREAEAEYTNQMAKRGHVYRAIKEREPEGVSQNMINLAIETGLYLVKRFG